MKTYRINFITGKHESFIDLDLTEDQLLIVNKILKGLKWHNDIRVPVTKQTKATIEAFATIEAVTNETNNETNNDDHFQENVDNLFRALANKLEK
jgi:hypothetical protein